MTDTAVVKEATLTHDGVEASYALEIGAHRCEVSYGWEAADTTLIPSYVRLTFDGQAEAVYQASDRYGGQLALDSSQSGPPWFLDDLPLILDRDLLVLGQNISSQTAEENDHLIQSWSNLYIRTPTVGP